MAEIPHLPPERPAHVIALPERMVFSVASSNSKYPGKRYRVDLLHGGGTGMCSCKNWAVAACPALKRGEPILTRQTTCKHVRAALHSFLCDTLPAMAKRMEGER